MHNGLSLRRQDNLYPFKQLSLAFTPRITATIGKMLNKGMDIIGGLDTSALFTFLPGFRVIAWHKFSFNCWPATVYITDSCCAKT